MSEASWRSYFPIGKKINDEIKKYRYVFNI